MARKQLRESEFSKVLRGRLLGNYDVVRVETREEDGWSDLLLVRRSDGTPCFLELKQIDHFTRDGTTRIDLDPLQPIFLWDRIKACPSVGAAVMLRVGKQDIYTFPAINDPRWVLWVRSRIAPDRLELPLCLKHSMSGLDKAMEAAYGARFTPPALALVTQGGTTW